jgi:myo-inositol 2-dehydrogenase/D-chiro-inositol 1-dehydrogenase
MIRVGWIGCGRHANAMLLPELMRHHVRLVALCDRDAKALEATATRFGVAAADRTTDPTAFLARRDLDAVGIAAGPLPHRDLAIAALDRGLPVFVEKPPGMNADDARAMAVAANRARKPVVVGFMKRFSTANRIALNHVRDAAFGTPASFLGEYMTAPTYFVGNPDYSGFLLHHCVHYLDLVSHLMGAPQSIKVRQHELAPGKLLLHVDWRFVSGALGTLVMGTHQSRATPMEWWQVMGDHCRVEVRNVHEVRLYRAPKFKVDDPEARLVDGEDTLVWEPNLTVAADEDHKGYHALLAAWLDIVNRRARSDAPTIEDGVAAMRVLDAVRQSMASGETVRLDR